jgi:hypothetical protein
MRYCAACGSFNVAYVRVIKGYYRMECRYCGSPGPFELRVVSSEAREPGSAADGRVTAGRPSLLTRRGATGATTPESCRFGPGLVRGPEASLGFTLFAGVSCTGATGLEPETPGLPDLDTRRRDLTEDGRERVNQAEDDPSRPTPGDRGCHRLPFADTPRLVPIWSERGPKGGR